ncbi:hypothetical protein CDEST_10582 [Colletotrichum destructivum]|uniref:Uncharacterized protein n=1 Tax=Colletotrichum destructivum TaxID=34406 RepID=A0AAX4IQU1_9PEZI|nr:hypothetical protein CDEST_10582 [Colletotrichum destructivum]
MLPRTEPERQLVNDGDPYVTFTRETRLTLECQELATAADRYTAVSSGAMQTHIAQESWHSGLPCFASARAESDTDAAPACLHIDSTSNAAMARRRICTANANSMQWIT